MNKLTREDLFSLEQYAEARPEFRAKVLEHKKNRQIGIGPNTTLYFEDRLTIQYQIQEMLRIEKVFEAAGINDELEAYNPLIPDGTNWKAAFMVEFPDVEERKEALKKLKGIQNQIWIRVADNDPIRPIANEDMDRESEEKTAAVHFLRFELTPEDVAAAKNGAEISMGIDHPAYDHKVVPVPGNVRDALVADLA